MIRSSSKIDAAALRLLTSIAGTREARVSAMALEHHRGAGSELMNAGLLVRHGSTMAAVAEDDLDDTPTLVMSHPMTGRQGLLGNMVWQEEDDSALRRIYALDMSAVARRMLTQIGCSLVSPVSYLDDAVLEFGTARLPRRTARVGVWVARGLTASRRFEQLRELAVRRPPEGLRIVISLDPAERLRPRALKGHEFVALADIVDHEDGLAVDPCILAARLLTGPSHEGSVWASGDGAVLIVHGERFDFRGSKQKVAVRMLAEAFNSGDRHLSTEAVLEEAACGRTVRRLSELFKGHPAFKEVIFETGTSCWIEA